MQFEHLWHKDRELGAEQKALMQTVYDLRYLILRKPLGMPRTEPFPRGLLMIVLGCLFVASFVHCCCFYAQMVMQVCILCA